MEHSPWQYRAAHVPAQRLLPLAKDLLTAFEIFSENLTLLPVMRSPLMKQHICVAAPRGRWEEGFGTVP